MDARSRATTGADPGPEGERVLDHGGGGAGRALPSRGQPTLGDDVRAAPPAKTAARAARRVFRTCSNGA